MHALVLSQVGASGEHLGSLSPFGFSDLRAKASLYLFLLDPGMLSRREESI